MLRHRFQVSPFSIVFVWTESQNASKCMRFHMKMHLCGCYIKVCSWAYKNFLDGNSCYLFL